MKLPNEKEIFKSSANNIVCSQIAKLFRSAKSIIKKERKNFVVDHSFIKWNVIESADVRLESHYLLRQVIV